MTKMHRLISIIDGMAIDIKSNTYSELNAQIKLEQRRNTYMQDYKAAIQTAMQYDTNMWNQGYYNLSGNSRWEFCNVDANWGIDKNGNFLLPRGYCERCTPINSTLLDRSGLRLSLNCSAALN